jgi:Transcriptional regulators
MTVKETTLEGYFEHPIVKTDNTLMVITSAMLNAKTSLLKKHGVSFQQYTILKTLYLSKGKPASIKTLTLEMFDKMSNTSRLVAKLEKKGLIKRKISDSDRRQVEIIISKIGEKVFIKAALELSEAILTSYKSFTNIELTEFQKFLSKVKSFKNDL